MLTAGELLEELQLLPPEAVIEVWFPADCRGGYDQDAHVQLQVVHDNDQDPVALAVIAATPECSDGAETDPCWFPADVQLIDRTGHRRPLCADHAGGAWTSDPATRIATVYGGPGARGWAVAADLLANRWADDPVVAAWVAHPARWKAPLPQQPVMVP